MFYKLKDKLGRYMFNRAAIGILATPPVTLNGDLAVTVLSQLQHKDLLLYLIALKSFSRYIPMQQVVVINDGSLTRNDRSILQSHVNGIQIRNAAEFRAKSCPQGGCWERLLAIAKFSQHGYVIQLDADTITLGTPDDVVKNIADGYSFTIGTWDNQTIEPMATCSQRVRDRRDVTAASHVQMLAEAAFADLQDCQTLRYVRGCAGFAGFSAGSMNTEFISYFSSAMELLIGEKWHAWGSEQVMSNVLVANAPKARVLPHPLYSDCLKMTSDNRFVHFIGDCRFKSNTYRTFARQVTKSSQTSRP